MGKEEGVAAQTPFLPRFKRACEIRGPISFLFKFDMTEGGRAVWPLCFFFSKKKSPKEGKEKNIQGCTGRPGPLFF